MSKKAVIFNKIIYDNIFCEDFKNLTEYNKIEFSERACNAILYAPNGVGKTSLTKVLSSEKNTEFSLDYDNKNYNNKNNTLFHVINDQNNRNIIRGKTADFLLGDNINKEFELRDRIEKSYNDLFSLLSTELKNKYKISKKSSALIKYIENNNLRKCIESLANNQSKGKDIKNDFVDWVDKFNLLNLDEYDQEKMSFITNDFNDKNIVNRIINLKEEEIYPNKEIKEYTENSEAIKILKKYKYKNECIVCDNILNYDEKLKFKTTNVKRIENSLDESTKKILADIIKKLNEENDPFKIREKITEVVNNGDKKLLEKLIDKIKFYLKMINNEINNLFITELKKTNLKSDIEEYKKLIKSKPKLSDEDILFIEKIINDHIEKKLEVKRDEQDNKNLKIVIDDEEFLEKDRRDLPLSTGEQNFISLSFEFLKAKNNKKEIIIIDDPISSFDSIYKNKIAYMLLKSLENKNTIILTHNLELIRVLEHQYNNSFNLYIFNNKEHEKNGFIRLKKHEIDLMLYIDKLLELFTNEIEEEIENKELFLISMIPFMRGYTSFLPNKNCLKEKLTKLMHGYNTQKEDINSIYKELFNRDIKKAKYEISAKDITFRNIDELHKIKILKDETKYPLLNMTLKHNLIYLYLRLKVENHLVSKYNIDTNKNKKLGSIINKCSKKDEKFNKNGRVFLSSRKTLLNEFNHFEGNMNIFQPAIDISNTALQKEINDILNFLSN